MKETVIRAKAHLPFESDYDKYFSRFRAFMGAKLSQKAKEKGAWENSDYDKGYFFMTSALAGSSGKVWYGSPRGTRGWCDSSYVGAGLRVAFQTIYNPQSSLVKGSRKLTQTSLVFDNNGKPVYDRNGERKKVTSTATIVKFGGKDCIWLNEEECKNGTATTMEFWTLELIDKAVLFDRDGKHNDYAKATELQNQCYDELIENCTEEEKAMLLEVETSSENGYKSGTPILQNEQGKRDFVDENSIEGIFQMLLDGEIDECEHKERLKSLSQKLRNDAQLTADYEKALQTVKEFSEKLTEETKKYNQEIERRRREEEEKARKEKELKSAFDKLDSQIEDMDIEKGNAQMQELAKEVDDAVDGLDKEIDNINLGGE